MLCSDKRIPLKNYLENGGNINVQRSQDGKTLMHVAAEADNEDTVKLLLKNNPDLNLKDSDGNAPVHSAFKSDGGEIIIMMILEHENADRNLQNNKGQTPLHLAALLGEFRVVKLLVKLGADMNIKNNKGRTPLDLAKMARNMEIANYLRSKKILERKDKNANNTGDKIL